MRVLMTTDPIGGVWNYTLELCNAMAAHGIQVSLAILGRKPTDAQRAELARLPNVAAHESNFRLEWMSEPWGDLDQAAGWLLSLEQELGADIVHLNHLMHADLPWHAPVLSVGHSCVLSWWDATQGAESAPPAEWSVYRRKVTNSLRAADCVAAPTGAMLSELQRFYGPFRRSVVINNARRRQSFSVSRKEPFVFSAGRLWDRAKNVDALVAVAPHISAPVVVAGEVTSPQGRVAHAPNLQLLGPLDPSTIATWYSRAAIYALPAHYEPFGLTALEAALSGCALILGDIPSLREVWGAAARYVPPDDHESLQETLNQFLANTSLRQRFGARAMARARQFTPARQVHEYLDLYRQLHRRAPERHAAGRRQ
jgi:glycogen(starch) synthase